MLTLLIVIAVVVILLWGISRLGLPEPFLTIIYCALAIALIVALARYLGAVSLF